MCMMRISWLYYFVDHTAVCNLIKRNIDEWNLAKQRRTKANAA